MTLLKSDLKIQIKRFLEDPKRGISVKVFAEMAGISETLLKDVFFYETVPMSETTQIRVSKAYESWRRGEIAVMQNRDNTVFGEYRKQPKPVLRKHTGLQMKDGKISIAVGVRNRLDYSHPTLLEQLEE